MRRLRFSHSVLRALAPHLWFVESDIHGLDTLVRRGDVCVDIGAEYGLYTQVLAWLAGTEGAVHSVEPLPGARRALSAGLRLTGSDTTVTLHPTALDAVPGRGTLSVPRRRGRAVRGRAYLTRGAAGPGPNAEFRRATRVDTDVHTLDGLCATHGISRVDFIKADVEGAESAVLAGGERTLRVHRPVLLLEIEQRHLAKYETTARDLVTWLAAYGYAMHTFRDLVWTPTAEVTSGHRNYLFMPPSRH